MFHIARDVATPDGHDPLFFDFEQREDHDLDAFAQKYISAPPVEAYSALEMEYEREDRFWRSFYPTYDLFWSHYMACQSWLLKGGSKTSQRSTVIEQEPPEPPEEVKRQVRKRDNERCLCCGSTSNLQIDHINPKYHGGDHSLENLQTLCKTCNSFKGDKYVIDFRLKHSKLQAPPESLPIITSPAFSAPISQWEEYVRRVINFFYGCCAVKFLEIASGSRYKLYWDVVIYGNHEPDWINAHLDEFLERVQGHRDRQSLIPKILTIRRDEATYSRSTHD